MTMEETTGVAQTGDTDEARTGALVERLFEAALGTVGLVGVYVRDRLGLYGALAEGGLRGFQARDQGRHRSEVRP